LGFKTRERRVRVVSQYRKKTAELPRCAGTSNNTFVAIVGVSLTCRTSRGGGKPNP